MLNRLGSFAEHNTLGDHHAFLTRRGDDESKTVHGSNDRPLGKKIRNNFVNNHVGKPAFQGDH